MSRDHEASIHHLVKANDIDGIKRLLATDPNAVNQQNENGQSPLWLAAEINSIEIAQLLLTAGANVDLQDKWGHSPLYVAVEKRSTEIAQLLLTAGANVDLQDQDRKTPIMIANEKGCEEIINLLIQKKTEVFFGHNNSVIVIADDNINNKIAAGYQAQCNYPKALEMYNDALRINEAIYGHDHPYVAGTINNIAAIYQTQGNNYPKALEMYNDALRIFRAFHRHDHPYVAGTINNIATVYQAQGNYPKALEMYNDALRLFRAFHRHDHPYVAGTVNKIAAIYKAQDNNPKALEMYNDALLIYEAMYGHDHPNVASAINNIASVYQAQDNNPKALEMYNDALRIYEAIHGHNHPNVASAINNIAAIYNAQGNNYPKALEMYNDALRIFRAFHGHDHPDVALTINNIAAVYKSQGNYPKALEMYNDALRINEAIYGHDDHPNVAWIINNIAAVYKSQGNYPKALEMYNDALGIFRAFHRHDHPDIAWTINQIAAVYNAQGNYPKALEMYNDALRINEAIYGHDHPNYAFTINDIATVYQAQGNYPKALEMYNDALRIFRAFHRHDHPDIAWTINEIAYVYNAQSNYPKALEMNNDALRIYEAIYGHVHPDVAGMIRIIAAIYKAQGNYPKALEMYNDALRINEAIYGHDHPTVAWTINDIASVYQAQGNYPKALAMNDDALRIYEAIYGHDHPNVAWTINDIAAVYKAQGNYPKALEMYNDALRIYEAIHGHDHPVVSRLLSTTGNLYVQLGNTVDAINVFENAIRNGGNNAITGYQNLACLYFYLSEMHKSEGKLDLYYTNHQKAYDTFKNGIEFSSTSGILVEYANFLIHIGEVSKAFDSLIKAFAISDNIFLAYGSSIKNIFPEVLRKHIEENNCESITIKSSHLAYYLLITNYKKFQELNLSNLVNMGNYLNKFSLLVNSEPDSLSYKLLGYSYLAIGKEQEAEEAFVLSVALKQSQSKGNPTDLEILNNAPLIKETIIEHDHYQVLKSSDIQNQILKACQVKTRKWNRSKIMIVGEGRAGKTALANSIIGNPFKFTRSTIGIDQFNCSVNFAEARNGLWSQYNRPEKECETAIAQIIIEENKLINDYSQTKEINRDDFITPVSTKATILPKYEAIEANFQTKVINHDSDITIQNKNTARIFQDSLTATPIVPAKTIVGLRPGEIDNYFVAKRLADNIQASSDLIISLFDFGGQSVFDVIHHLFLTPYGVYIVVFNMIWLVEGASPEGKDSCMSRMKYWVNSIMMHTFDSQSMKIAPIVFVGTHKDQVNNRSSMKAISDTISSVFSGIIPFWKSVIKNVNEGLCFFPINNVVGRDEGIFPDMLQKIENCIKIEKYVTQETPLVWLQAFDKLKADKTKISFTLSETHEILTSCGIEKREYSEVLSLFNKMGELLWINEDGLRDIIIMDPIHYFVTPATRVICKNEASEESGEMYRHENDILNTCELIYSNHWKQMITTGIVANELLVALIRDNYEQVINLMIKFGLIVKVRKVNRASENHVDSSNNVSYIVPTLLPFGNSSMAPTTLSSLLSNSNDTQNTFIICFGLPQNLSALNFFKVAQLQSDLFMPIGLPFRLLVKILEWSQLSTIRIDILSERLYQNDIAVVFGNRTFRLRLLQDHNCICITVERCKNFAALMHRLKGIVSEVIKECFSILSFKVMVPLKNDGMQWYAVSFESLVRSREDGEDIVLPDGCCLSLMNISEVYSKWCDISDTSQDCDIFLSSGCGVHDKKFVSLVYDALLDFDYSYIFLNNKVLQLCDDVYKTLVKALSRSKVFVPFFSHDASFELEHHNPHKVDMILLEWILALSFHKSGSLKFLPISYGSINEASAFQSFDDNVFRSLSTIRPSATLKKAKELLEELKISSTTLYSENNELTIANIANDIIATFQHNFNATQFDNDLKKCVLYCAKIIHRAYQSNQPIPFCNQLKKIELSRKTDELEAAPVCVFCLICRCNVEARFNCRKCQMFVCIDCFPTLVRNQINHDNMGSFKLRKGHIICSNLNCSNPFTEKELTLHCDDVTHDLYRDSRDKVRGQLEVEKQLPVEKKKWLSENRNEVERRCRYIIDTILLLCCPCGAPFAVDIEECLALTCGTCRDSFCGWCLMKCGSSAQAHKHVENCVLGNGLQYNDAEFKRVHSDRCITELRNYLDSISDEKVRKQVEDTIVIYLSEKEQLALGVGTIANKNYATCEAFFNLDLSQLQYEMVEANLVGKGSFGDVYYGQSSNQLYVIERLDILKTISMEDAKKCYDEIEITKLRNHPNLHKLLGVNIKEGLLISLPYNTSLFDFLYVNSTTISTPLTPILKLNLIKDIVCAIQYLHENGVVHRDIRPINILLVNNSIDSRITAQVTGFGLSRSLSNINQQDVPAYSLQYMSPELLLDYQSSSPTFTTSSDIYALGILLNEILTERIPWINIKTEQYLIREVTTGNRPPYFSYSAKTETEKILIELIGNANHGCLSGNVNDRPNANTILDQISKLKGETPIKVDTSSIIDNQLKVNFTRENILEYFPVMIDAIGLYTYDSRQTSADNGICYQLRGSELFLLAHYYRDNCNLSEKCYYFIIENMCQLTTTDQVDVDTGYIINNNKIMKDALGLYTLSSEQNEVERHRIYGNDLLLLARYFYYIDGSEMSTKCYYFIKDSYPEVVSQLIRLEEKKKSENLMRAPPDRRDNRSKFAKFLDYTVYKYLTYGFLSTGRINTDEELNIWNDRIDLRKYAEVNNFYEGSLPFEGNVGFKENVIGNLCNRFLPTAQFSQSDLVVYYGGHGHLGTGDWLIVEGGSIVVPCLNNNQVNKITRNGNAIVTFDEFMSAVEKFNCEFSPRVKVHIVLFSCYSGHWIEKLRAARERDANAYPDIGVIITAADKDTKCQDFCFSKAFWGKEFGPEDEYLLRALGSRPQKYISSVNPTVSLMTKEDFAFKWFQNGQHWKENVSSLVDISLNSTGGVPESKDTVDNPLASASALVNTSHVTTNVSISIMKAKNLKLHAMECLRTAWGFLHNSNMVTEGFKVMLDSTFQLKNADDLLNCVESDINTLADFLSEFMKPLFKQYIEKAKNIMKKFMNEDSQTEYSLLDDISLTNTSDVVSESKENVDVIPVNVSASKSEEGSQVTNISGPNSSRLNKHLHTAWGYLHNSKTILKERRDELNQILVKFTKPEDLLACDDNAINTLSKCLIDNKIYSFLYSIRNARKIK